VTDPKIGMVGSVPTARKGGDLGGLAQPDSGLALGGRALVGKECDKTAFGKSPVGLPESLNVVVDWRPMVVSDELE
jgi:hypothetical protein